MIYDGQAFPEWQGQLLVGSLKAMDVFRIKLLPQEDGSYQYESELIVEDLARIRDIEVAPNGDVLLLLEHNDGGQIARITPQSLSLTERNKGHQKPKRIIGRIAHEPSDTP